MKVRIGYAALLAAGLGAGIAAGAGALAPKTPQGCASITLQMSGGSRAATSVAAAA